MRLERVHVFGSRRDAFKQDGVLQENLIVHYRRDKSAAGRVVISSSAGEQDLEDLHEHAVPRASVLAPEDRDAVLFLPTDADDLRVMDVVRAFRHTLGHHGLEVSTGPVVPFRAEQELIKRPGKVETFPMLWMQHVHAGGVTWPLGDGFRKAEHIRASAPAKLLVPNATYVLMRRFSAKEEERRLTAAVLREGELPGEQIGLENHLNFIHRPRGKLTPDEAVALAALLNSSLFDTYFRISNGNTQVSATELRVLPLPAPEVLQRLAKRAAAGHGFVADAIVTDSLAAN
jgi:adenine-specific DNA-methyltransferase